MNALLIVLASVVATCLAAPATPTACVPPQAKFYWKTPCDGQSYPDRVTVSEVDASQNGKPVDQAGGFDISANIDLHTLINDQYGTVATPLIDVTIVEYSKNAAGTCVWKNVPTLGLLDNIDGCSIMKNCHLSGAPTTLDFSINMKDLAGPLYAGISTDTYYGLSLTFKDGKTTPFLCVYAQDIVLKK